MKETILLGKNLKGNKIELDLQELITGRTLLCSISRFGKTWTARRIIEQVFGKTGVIIVDVEGEYATLRDRYPLLIIGKDVPLIPESAEFLSDQVLEHNLSVIIDGSDPQLDIAAFQEFLARFIERFIAIETTARKPYLWILEEADELAPESGIARSICLGQIRKLIKKGGKRGLGAMILTQRPAFVSKFVISQCLAKGERIITAEGLKPIEGLQVGNLVLTHMGRFRRVTHVFSREYSGDLVEIRTKGWNGVTRLTPEHPLLVRRLLNRVGGTPVIQQLQLSQWLEASALVESDYVTFPRITENVNLSCVQMPYHYLNRGGRTPHFCDKSRTIFDFENLMRIVGYYLAEGSICNIKTSRTAAHIRWSFGKNASERTFARNLVSSLGALGFNSRLEKVQGLWQVSASSTALANWLTTNFGTGASRKRIPVWVKRLPSMTLVPLLAAYIDGDGHRVPNHVGQLTATTVSEDLAVDIRDIALKTGRRAFIYRRKGHGIIQGRHVRSRPIFFVNIAPKSPLGNGQGLTPFDDHGLYLKVKSATRAPYSGLVYNLEVEEDNSFCTIAHSLHNCASKMIGRTEWPDDLAILRKFARIPEKYADPESTNAQALKNLTKGEFYVAGDFIDKDDFVKVGPVLTKHLGSTPEIVPPAPEELKAVLAQLSERLPAIIQEKLAPAVPKVAEIEKRIAEKFEAQWQARLARKDKELASIKNRLEAKYETEIADLNRKLDDAVRHATTKSGGVSDLLSHPLVQKNLSKFNDKQRGFVELLESKGPQDAEHSSLFLEIKPKSVPVFVHELNRKIPKLIENQQGRYTSRLAKLFPVTEEAQAEAKELADLRGQMLDSTRLIDAKNVAIRAWSLRVEEEQNKRLKVEKEYDELAKKVSWLELQLKALKASHAATVELAVEATGIKPESEALSPENPPQMIQVEATLHRTLTKFDVITDKEVLTADESSWEGKILARGLEGFFQEPKGIGKIMAELVRRYNVGESGGNRTTVNDRLAMLVSKGILDRKQEAGQWMYFPSPEFTERVKTQV